MSGAGGSASSAAAALMQADRAACVCKGAGLLQVWPASVRRWWLILEHRGHGAHIYPPVLPVAQRRAKHAGSLCRCRCYRRPLGPSQGVPLPPDWDRDRR